MSPVQCTNMYFCVPKFFWVCSIDLFQDEKEFFLLVGPFCNFLTHKYEKVCCIWSLDPSPSLKMNARTICNFKNHYLLIYCTYISAACRVTLNPVMLYPPIPVGIITAKSIHTSMSTGHINWLKTNSHTTVYSRNLCVHLYTRLTIGAWVTCHGRYVHSKVVCNQIPDLQDMIVSTCVLQVRTHITHVGQPPPRWA
jgi:hypothetical protein